jgi:large subunit ribosomal protein L6
MSRIGKLPVQIPAGVETKIDGQKVSIKGPKGTLSLDVHPLIQLEKADKSVEVRRNGDAPLDRSLHGLTRALLANMVHGVTSGFERTLQIVGIGYKAQVQGKKVVLNLGYSHPIEFPIPEGINIAVDNQTTLRVSGPDKQKVGQVSAELRRLRPVEPYKGKGIRYSDEKVRQKEGKAAS